MKLAVELARSLLPLLPVPEVARVLGVEKIREGSFEDGRKMLAGYFNSEESTPEGCLATAALLRKEKLPSLALKGLQDCTKCHGTNAFFIESALAHLAIGNKGEAERSFQGGTAAAADKGAFAKLAGAALIASGYPKSALVYLKEAMATESREGWMDALPALAAAHIHAGDRAGALQQVQAFVSA